LMPLSLRKHFFLTSGGLPCLLPLTPAIVLRYVCFLAGASPRLRLSLLPPMPTPRCRRCHLPLSPSPPSRRLRSNEGRSSTVTATATATATAAVAAAAFAGNGLHGERRPPRRRPRRAPRGSAPRLARVSRLSINRTHTRSHHAPRRREDAVGRRLGGRPTRCEPAGRERIAQNGAAVTPTTPHSHYTASS
jgi:hypothetical protein